MFMMLLTNPGLMLRRFFSSRENFLVIKYKKLCAFAGEDASKVEARQRINIMMLLMKKVQRVCMYMISFSERTAKARQGKGVWGMENLHTLRSWRRRNENSIYNRTSGKKCELIYY